MIIDCLASSDCGRMISTLLAVQALLAIQAAGSQQLPRQTAPTTAVIQGVVRNPRGLGLGGVVVRLWNASSQTEDRRTSTTGDGAFRFLNVSPGTYDLRA